MESERKNFNILLAISILWIAACTKAVVIGRDEQKQQNSSVLVHQFEDENSDEKAEERAKVTSTMPEAGSYNIDEDWLKNHFEPPTCPGTKGCIKCCPIGRVRDAKGCFTCQCKQMGKFELDVLVNKYDFFEIMKHYDNSTTTVPPGGRDALNLAQFEWPRKGKEVIVPYTMDPTITAPKKKKIMKAIERYDAVTCVRFKPRTNEKDYVEYYGVGGCSSHIGKVGGKQQIKIGKNCETKLGTVIHEMMHALGFWHEQSRGDRDDFVTIEWDMVKDVAKKNFDKQDQFWESYGSPYDLGSVMHYGGDYFAKKRGKATIRDKKTGKKVKAQREDFSKEDIRQINLKYKCSDYLEKDDLLRLSLKGDLKECKDKMTTSYCSKALKRGFCAMSGDIGRNCRKTCDLCDGTKTYEYVSQKGDCQDKLSSCQEWKNKGHCTDQYKSYMQKKCAKTCGFCTTKKLLTYKKNDDCVDFHSSCAEWKDFGFCQSTNYMSYMSKVCAKSCKTCLNKDGTFPKTEDPDIELYFGKCGLVDPEMEDSISERIVGGKPTSHGTIPWQASLFDSQDRHLCGATLIDERHILTAAHCFSRQSNPPVEIYYIYLGKYYRDSHVHDKGSRKVKLEQITIHPQYDPFTSENDIAILKTEDEIAFTNYIRPVCLPSTRLSSQVGKFATVSGWGETKEIQRSASTKLQKAEVKIINSDDCNKWLNKIFSRANQITDNMICAGYEDGRKDSCQGDSGGPLVVKNGESRTLIGLVSWGYGCGEVQQPGVYTKVQNYLDWIEDIREE